jgi:hypothetical protein
MPSRRRTAAQAFAMTTEVRAALLEAFYNSAAARQGLGSMAGTALVTSR